jgi:hypothetical protein
VMAKAVATVRARVEVTLPVRAEAIAPLPARF